MLDNELIKLFREIVLAQEAAAGIKGTPIKQAFQPTQQGVNTKPTAYFHKVGDRPVGCPHRKDEWDDGAKKLIHTETQQYETTFQISTLATQDPNTPEQYTASDVLNLIRYILQSTKTIAEFQANGVGIYRVAEVQNPYFLDDHHRNEASPYLRFTLTHKQIISSDMAAIATYEAQILTV